MLIMRNVINLMNWMLKLHKSDGVNESEYANKIFLGLYSLTMLLLHTYMGKL